MSYDGKLLARARERLAARREENERIVQARREETARAVPGLAKADAELRAALGQVIALSSVPGEHGQELAELEALGAEICEAKKALLVSSGYPADYLDDIVTCRRCGDSGYTKDGQLCSCLHALYEQERERELSRLAAVGDESFGDFSLDYYQGEDRECMALTLSTCRRYAIEFGDDSPDLLFQGGTGLGKTMLSGCVAKAVSAKGYSVCYETASDAFRAFEEEKFNRSAEAGERVRRMLDCRLLILDDLGTEMTTSFTQSALYNIINTRLNTGGKTIISTNLTDAQLAERYMPQISSRIFGEYETLVFRGRDVRAQKKENRYQ